MNIVFKVVLFNFVNTTAAKIFAENLLFLIKQGKISGGKFCGVKEEIKGCTVPVYDKAYNRKTNVAGATFSVMYEAENEYSLNKSFPELMEAYLSSTRKILMCDFLTVLCMRREYCKDAHVFAKIEKRTENETKLTMCADGYRGIHWRKPCCTIRLLAKEMQPVKDTILEEKHE